MMARLYPPLLIVLWALSCTTGPQAAISQVIPGGSEPGGKPQAADGQPRFQSEGVAACARCHDNPTPEDQAQGITKFVLLTEYTTWAAHDRHEQAYRLLGSELGRQMNDILAQGDPNYDVRQDQRCLSCHANWQAGRPRPKAYELTRGVTCEACHGPASEYLALHFKKSWRTRSSAKKTELGMIDLRDPAVRAELCASCHLGNAAQGKIVTHLMYAAGHPPLPPFELQTFADHMPPHWRTWEEKTDDFPHRAAMQQMQHYVLGDRVKPKSAMIGAVITMRESLRLFASQTDVLLSNNLTTVPPPTETVPRNAAAAVDDLAPYASAAWPELALFDCSACHHDLTTSDISWRQQRGYREQIPGRPIRPQWGRQAVQLAFRMAYPAGTQQAAISQFQEQQALLASAVAAQPFGDVSLFRQHAAALDAQLNQLASRLSDTRFGISEARAAVEFLADAAMENLDYQSARHLAWSLDVWLEALQPHRSPRDSDFASPREPLFALPPRKAPTSSGSSAGTDAGIAPSLAEAMRRAAEFDPRQFHRSLQRRYQNADRTGPEN
jgi:hypothetical protein